MNTKYVAGLAASALMIGMSSAAVIMSDDGTSTPTAADGFTGATNNAGTGSGVNDYSDNGGLGQSFTLAPGSDYTLNSFSLMFDGDASGGGEAFDSGNTWTILISRYDNASSGGFAERTDDNGTAYDSQYTSNTFISSSFSAAGIGATPDVGDWVTTTFTGGDVLTLEGGHTYSIQLGSDTGWSRWAAGDSDTIAGGERFRPYGSSVGGDNYVNASSDNDRAIVINLSAVPEPSSTALLGLAGLALILRRRK